MRPWGLLLGTVLVAIPALGFAPAKPIKPEPAVGDYTSSQYALTFKAPEHAFFCPLPPGWVGSDHGTLLFLRRPDSCYGAGYPSSGRGFEPREVPRIEVFYAYYLGDIPRDPKPPCHAIDHAELFGKPVSLCRQDKDGLAIITAGAVYSGDSPSELQMTLVAKPAEAGNFVSTFKALLASVHTCSDTWTTYNKKGRKLKSGKMGRGPQCPPGQWY